jgi:hypothetical protein
MAPYSTLAAVTTLSLGIAATNTVFTMVIGVLLLSCSMSLAACGDMLLVAVGLSACMIPARRAMLLDPVAALEAE